MKKYIKKIKNFFENYKKELTFTLIGLIGGLLIMSLFIPERIAKLSDGTEPIVTITNKNITADEYYDDLKNAISIELLIQNIDTKILNDMYETTRDMETEVLKQMSDTISEYTNYYKYDEKTFLANNGFKSKNEFYTLLLLNYKRNLYYRKYLKENINSNEINNYYLKSMNPDMEIQYLYSSDVEIIKTILNEINNGSSYQDVANKYNKKVSMNNFKYVSFDNKEIHADVYKAACSLKANSVSTSYVEADGYYFIIYKGNVKEKAKLEDVKDRIIEKLIDLKDENDTDGKVYYKSLVDLREKNNITFHDTVLKDKYNEYIKSSLN